MITLEGRYFDGQRPLALPARLEIDGQEARLTGEGFAAQYAVGQLAVSPRTGAAERFVSLSDNGQFLCSDTDLLDGLPQESPTEGPVAWLEERWEVALFGVVMTACLLLLGYLYGLPAAATRIAARIPIATEQAVAREALQWFDEHKWFTPSSVEGYLQQDIKEGFEQLVLDSPYRKGYRLEFRASKFGANAFALPGGIIVITDDMVRAGETTEEVLAVLAHEIGHVELHHIMRSVLQSSVVAVAVAAITSDAAALNGAVAGLPLIVMNTKYSREFETEADEYGFRLLSNKGLSPAAFASIMEKISKNNKGPANEWMYLSTHPLTEKRIARARETAGRAIQEKH